MNPPDDQSPAPEQHAPPFSPSLQRAGYRPSPPPGIRLPDAAPTPLPHTDDAAPTLRGRRQRAKQRPPIPPLLSAMPEERIPNTPVSPYDSVPTLASQNRGNRFPLRLSLVLLCALLLLGVAGPLLVSRYQQQARDASIASQTATDVVATAHEQATGRAIFLSATAFATQPYRVVVPGPCNGDTLHWQINGGQDYHGLVVQCLADSLALSWPSSCLNLTFGGGLFAIARHHETSLQIFDWQGDPRDSLFFTWHDLNIRLESNGSWALSNDAALLQNLSGTIAKTNLYTMTVHSDNTGIILSLNGAVVAHVPQVDDRSLGDTLWLSFCSQSTGSVHLKNFSYIPLP